MNAAMDRAITAILGRTREKSRRVPANRTRATASIDEGRWIIVGETGSHLGFTPRYARAAKGERAHGAAPRNIGINHTVVAAIGVEEMLPSLIVEGGVTESAFEMWGEHRPAPSPRPGHVVAMDNLRGHHAPHVRELLKA